MERSNEVQHEVRRLSQAIFRGYKVFLEEGHLKDTNLTRMTYFSAVKKEYIENQVEFTEAQEAILEDLDRWMSETQQAMVTAIE